MTMTTTALDIRELLIQRLQDRERKERDHKTFYASELGYCPLKLFFTFVHPKEPDPHTLQIFKMGDLVHEYIQRIVQDATDAEVEVPIRQLVDPERGIEIHGRIDILHEGVPYELKSSARIPSGPYAHHVAQLNAYLKMLDRDVGYLVYVEKNTFDIAQFEVRRNDYLWDATLDKIRAVHDAVEVVQNGGSEGDALESLIPRVVDTWECRYCVYRDVCPRAII